MRELEGWREELAHNIALRNADLAFCRSGKDYQRVIGEIKQGFARQYMLSTRQFTPVAILWSNNSQRAAWTLGKFEDFKKTENEVVSGVIGAELDPRFVSEAGVASGELEKRGVKALFLPMTLSLGAGAKKGGLPVLPALQKFAAAGGIIVSTDEPQFDEFLQPAKLPDDFAGKLIKFAGVKEKLVETCAPAGVKPWLRVTAPDGSRVKNLATAVHKLPGAENAYLLTILRAPVGRKEVVGADGVTYSEPDASGGKEIETLSVDVSALGELNYYDLRQQRPLKAAGRKLTLQMRAGDGYPLAALPYTVDKLKVSRELKDRNLIVSWELKGSAKTFASHVARVECADADSGKAAANFCANVVTGADGKGSIVFPLSAEDQGRQFVVTVRDILSGVSGKK